MLRRYDATVETYVAHVVDSIRSIGGEGGTGVTVAPIGEDEAKECGERFYFLKDEGVVFVRDQSSLLMDPLASSE